MPFFVVHEAMWAALYCAAHRGAMVRVAAAFPVAAQSGGMIGEADAAALIADAEQIIALLSAG